MFRLAESLGGAERDWPFVSRAADMGREKMQISIQFPEGYEFAYAPETQVVERPGITAGFKVERTDTKLVLTRHMTIAGAHIEPEDFPGFLAEMKRLDEAIDTRVEILRRPADEASDGE
ncbi:MAG: hypothetical protein AAF368_11205 [Planctomycetota bacterium]